MRYESRIENPEWAIIEDEIESILDDLTEREMRDLLRSLVNEDERMGRRIFNQFGRPNTSKTQAGLNAAIDAAWSRCQYRGYIDYRNASMFEQEVREAFWDAVTPLIRPDSLHEAFEVSYAFLLRLEEIEIDDSDGFFSAMMYLCADRWSAILSLAENAPEGESVRSTVCGKLCSFAKENPVRDQVDIYWYLSDEVVDFLVEEFADDAVHAGELLDLIDVKLAEATLPGIISSGSLDYEQVRWATLRLKVMAAQGVEEHCRLDFAKPYMRHSSIRTMFVEERHGRGDLDGAIALLVESGEASDHESGKTAFAEKLAELYEEAGQIDLARAEMRTLAVNPRHFSGKETHWFEKLKGLTPAEEWPVLRDELLSSMTNNHYRRSCLAIEKLYTELMVSIEGESEDRWHGSKLWEVRRFREELGGLFPERIAPIYRKGIESLLAGYSTNRKTYQEAVDLMEEMAEVDVDATADLAEWIRNTYPRRRALMDELQKAGW